MINTNNVNDLIGAAVHGDGEKELGTVGQVYVDSNTQSPTWVTIKTGRFGGSETFAPLTDATFDSGVVRVPYDKEFVKDAPRIDDDGSLSQEDEDALYRYYGNDTTTGADTTGRQATDRPTEEYDVSGPTTDDAMTRSEQHLRVGTEKVESGRARLRKHVVTETVSKTVPVSHEEVTLHREPITDANIGDATTGAELSSEEHEVVLTGEQVITSKETVPVERVKLDTETVTEQQQVSEEVAHEEIELIDPDAPNTKK